MDASTITAIGGVVGSLLVGLATFSASRRSTATTRNLGDTAARDRLIAGLQERVDQQNEQLTGCERAHRETRHELEVARYANDALTAELSNLRRNSDQTIANLQDKNARLELRITQLSRNQP